MDTIGPVGLQPGERASSCPPEGLPRPSDSLELVQQCLQQFKVTKAQLQHIQASLLCSMEQALKGQDSPAPSVRMLPTYVGSTPHGTEQGELLVLELGATGASLRVLWVTLTGTKERSVEPKSQEFVIPQEVTLGAGQQLFDFAARCLSEFLDAHPTENQGLKLGFNFSFPCHQTGLDRVSGGGGGETRGAREWEETAARVKATREKNSPAFLPPPPGHPHFLDKRL
ncbi:Hk3 [Phodopus roborovskii]|uniref:Phosphotransferase n=1 Tax=Phodopus roborovskii TaxID=109678 RepID=A0AAU9ZPQ2_PHORO|nr:Hk3 [Phodopus roborovskii]